MNELEQGENGCFDWQEPAPGFCRYCGTYPYRIVAEGLVDWEALISQAEMEKETGHLTARDIMTAEDYERLQRLRRLAGIPEGVEP